MVIVLNSAAPPLAAGPVSAPGLVLIGVGPGDPEWLTIAAHQALQQAEVVAYPVARRDAIGMAATIVERFLLPEQQRLPLVFPMVRAMESLRPAWIAAADALAAAVTAGRRVVFLCEGDVSLFATGSYVLLALRQHHPDCPVRLIPGVSSVAAAAAQGAWPLALQQEGLLIRPCPDDAAALQRVLRWAQEENTVLALLKLGQRWRWVQPLLAEQHLLHNALFAERIGWPDQRVLPAAAVPAEERPYFSQLLIRQGEVLADV